jgi:uncharacterized protein (TIGR02145 family)
MNKYLDKIGLELYHDLLQTELSHLADELNDVVIGKLIDNNFYVQENIDYVEIGNTKWATRNVGANSITDAGLYFQWGDTQGYTASQVGSGSGQKYFGWADYKYGNGTDSPGYTDITKYNYIDNKEVLDASDDAVTAAWGGNWRMPTNQEFHALGDAVNSTWTSSYQGSGVSGLICTDKTDSSKVLFFPAAGYCKDGSVINDGSFGHCWSSSVYNSEKAWKPVFYFHDSFGFSVDWTSNGYRYFGYPIRGVWDGDMY